MRRCVALAGLALGAIAPACVIDDNDTCRVPTEEMSIIARVVDAGPSLRAEIDFEAGDRTGIDRPLLLCDDDLLEINGEEPVETVRPGRIVYAVTFPSDGERTMQFDLDRRGLGERVTIEAALPVGFSIVAPMIDAEISRALDLAMEWDPPQTDPERTMRIELGEDIGEGVCIYTAEGEHHYKRLGGVDVPDDGNWMIPGGSVHSDLDECAAYYQLKRIAPAPYPAGFGPGGYVEARVDRTVAFRSVP